MTRPGCHETITWIVMNKPVYVTVEQASRTSYISSVTVRATESSLQTNVVPAPEYLTIQRLCKRKSVLSECHIVPISYGNYYIND